MDSDFTINYEIFEKPWLLCERLGTVPERKAQVNRLLYMVKNRVAKGSSFNVFIYGWTGTGKTLVVKHILREAEKMDVTPLYINCQKDADGSSTELFRFIASNIRNEKLPVRGFKASEYFQLFEEHVKEKKLKVLLAVDEFDSIIERERNDNFLYKLLRSETPLGVIAVSNKVLVKEKLDPRTKSSIESELIFQPYDKESLKKILRLYVEHGLNPEKVWEDSLEYLAERTVEDFGGDARRAVAILKKAYEAAAEEGANHVYIYHLSSAIDEVEKETAINILLSLPENHRLIFVELLKHLSQKWPTATPGGEGKHTTVAEFHSHLKRSIKKPPSYRTLHGILRELKEHKLIEVEKVGRGKSGGVANIVRLQPYGQHLYSIGAEREY